MHKSTLFMQVFERYRKKIVSLQPKIIRLNAIRKVTFEPKVHK